MCPGTDVETSALLYLIKNRCCVYLKSNQEGVVGEKMRGSEKERKSK